MLRCLGPAVDYPREGAPPPSWGVARRHGAGAENGSLVDWIEAIDALGALNALELDDWLGRLPCSRQLALGAALAAAQLAGVAGGVARFQLLAQCVHDHLSARWLAARAPPTQA